jgi:hypothetical protein
MWPGFKNKKNGVTYILRNRIRRTNVSGMENIKIKIPCVICGAVTRINGVAVRNHRLLDHTVSRGETCTVCDVCTLTETVTLHRLLLGNWKYGKKVWVECPDI